MNTDNNTNNDTNKKDIIVLILHIVVLLVFILYFILLFSGYINWSLAYGESMNNSCPTFVMFSSVYDTVSEGDIVVAEDENGEHLRHRVKLELSDEHIREISTTEEKQTVRFRSPPDVNLTESSSNNTHGVIINDEENYIRNSSEQNLYILKGDGNDHFDRMVFTDDSIVGVQYFEQTIPDKYCE